MTTPLMRRTLPAAALLALATGLSAQQPLDVLAEGPSAGAGSGTALAWLDDLDGDGQPDLAVGGPDDDRAGLDAGSVQVLSGDDGSLLFEVLGFGPGDQLGAAVADAGDIDGDGTGDLIVGAPQDPFGLDTSWAGNGPGYVLLLSGADGSLLHHWQGGYGRTPDFGSFGRRVANAGDLDGDGTPDLVVAERDRDIELGDDHDPVGGRVWIYSGADGSVIRRVEGLTTQYGHLGWGLAAGTDLDGDGQGDLVLGSPLNDAFVAVSGATGAVLFQDGGATNFLGQDIVFLDDVDDDGTPDLAVGGDDAIEVRSGADGSLLSTTLPVPGAPVYDGPRLAALGDVDGDGVGDFAGSQPLADKTGTDAGQVRVFSGDTGEQLLLLNGQAAGDQLGAAVLPLPDQDGDQLPDLLLGAPGADGGAGSDAGQLIAWSTRGPRRILALYSPNPVDSNFGQRVAAAGDVDNDGWGDVIVGLPDSAHAFFVGGRAQVFSGRDGSLLHDFDPPGPYFRLGWSVDGIGDSDGDGFEDLAIGGPYPPVSEGQPFVELRSGRDGSLLHLFEGPLGSQFGVGVAGVGDLDGDGRGDLAVGAPNDSSSGTAVGSVRVVSGASGATLFEVLGGFSFSDFGQALAAAGDVDDDGTPDVLIGARLADTGNGSGSGRVLVVSGVDGSVLHDIPGGEALANAGWGLTGVGDVDGDGHDDFAYGQPGAEAPDGGSGVVVVRSGDTGAVLLSFGSVPADGPFGRSVAAAGDVDGDGVPDLAVGVPGADDAVSQGGAVRFHSGADGSLLGVWASPVPNNQAGEVVSSAGDIDGDGTVDLVLGALNSPEDPGPAGAVYLINPLPAITAWESLGGALTGGAGTPRLTGGGTLEDGAPATLSLVDALPGTSAALVFGTFELSLPFKGGTLVPDPFLIVYGLPTGPDGLLEIVAPWPAGVPSGFQLLAQHWISDPAGPAGFAASNGVIGTVP